MENVYDIIVIGGGPCGIATIVEAKHNGFENVLLLEKGDNHSQTIRKFYKDGKRVDKVYKGLESETKGSVEFFDGTKESTLNYFDRLLDDGKIDAMFNSEVESVKKNNGVFEVVTSKGTFKSKNVMIGIGKMGRPNKPEYKIPPSLTQVVNFNLNSCNCGEKILVVGGGNSAAEYALELSKCNKVTLCYRKDKFTRLNEINEAGVFEYNKAGKLELKLGIDIVGLDNENGKVNVKFNNSTNEIYDRIIYAIGGSTPVDFLQKCGVELKDNEPILDENLQTKTPGLFVGGDIASKSGGSIVVALNDAHTVISYIMKSK
ncbi:NAD(P)-binding domain-containing protein [Campylobacter hyointestinalis]|uniref:NAD(P)-binding domain-containing protein n=1 Tax=Campylobacter hyointestinalis TaxID=198 RepID=UPI000DCEE065|nr:NAD(P)-binding domain-containing protein [Campylobacter hyointestinalis]RAZ48634.1 cbb3-type cytochrome oxidase assembly protein CcoS [Campylobacter hyointestinalis subsp. lawsonii]